MVGRSCSSPLDAAPNVSVTLVELAGGCAEGGLGEFYDRRECITREIADFSDRTL